jgi:hypothetical protein
MTPLVVPGTAETAERPETEREVALADLLAVIGVIIFVVLSIGLTWALGRV